MAKKPVSRAAPPAEDEDVRGIEVPPGDGAVPEDPRGELVGTIEVSDEDAARLLGAPGDKGDDGLEPGRVIMVRSVRPEGRRRAGMAFGPDPQPINAAAISAEQLQALVEDPDLIVSLGD